MTCRMSAPLLSCLFVAVLTLLAPGDARGVAAQNQSTGAAVISCATACRIVIDADQRIEIPAGGRQEVQLSAGMHLIEASANGKVVLKKIVTVKSGERHTIDVVEPPSDASRTALATLSSGCWQSETKSRRLKDQCPVDASESWFVCFLKDVDDPGLITGSLSYRRLDMLAMGDVTMNQMSACMEKTKGVNSVMTERALTVRAVGAAPPSYVSSFKKCGSRECEGESREELRGRLEFDGTQMRLIPDAGERLAFTKYQKKD